MNQRSTTKLTNILSKLSDKDANHSFLPLALNVKCRHNLCHNCFQAGLRVANSKGLLTFALGDFAMKFFSFSFGAAIMATAMPSAAQDSSSVVVRKGSDPATPLIVGELALPFEAFEPIAVSKATDPLEITGGVDLQLGQSNLPGREDGRPRPLHTGSEATFNKAGSANALSVPVIFRPQLKPGWMLSHHIDVGQGNATLLEFSCGLALIDTGGQESGLVKGADHLLEYINEVFARRPDLNRSIAVTFLTHPHKDHTVGVLKLLAGGASPIKINSVVTNASTNTRSSGWQGQKKLLDYATSKGINATVVRNEQIIRSDGLTSDKIDPLRCADVDPEIRVLWGSDGRGHGWAKDENNNSVVIRVDFGESSFLFTGDLEEDAQPEFIQSYALNPDIIDADVYQVGHHGSKNGTTAALLTVLKPEIAVIGSGNPEDQEPGFSAYNFGHPNLTSITLLSNDQFGVTARRPPGRFAVGLKGRTPGSNKPPRFQSIEIDKAIFSTGWDGDIVIAASKDGSKVVQTD